MTTSAGDPLAITEPTTSTETDDGPEPKFSCLEAFVTGYLAPALARKATSRRTWCPTWWAHPEAVLRLWAVWQAWEAFYAQGGVGPSSWWVYHLDHHLARLFDAEIGPFSLCRDGHSEAAQPLPCEPAPPDVGPIVVGSPEAGAAEPADREGSP
jgi:hypothetical protein